jgi:hypothetical protein
VTGLLLCDQFESLLRRRMQIDEGFLHLRDALYSSMRIRTGGAPTTSFNSTISFRARLMRSS